MFGKMWRVLTMARREKKREAFNIWLHPDNPDHAEVLAVLTFFRGELTKKARGAKPSKHQVNVKVFVMAMRALAKNRRPDLLIPRDDTDTMIDRIAAGMYEIQEEIAALSAKLESGVVLQAGDLSRLSSRIQEGYGDFEQSIANGFTSFDDEDGE